MQNGREIGSFGAQAQGPSFATLKGHSDRVKALIGNLDAGVVTIHAAGRQYKVDLAGIGPARSQLDACVAEMTKPSDAGSSRPSLTIMTASRTLPPERPAVRRRFSATI